MVKMHRVVTLPGAVGLALANHHALPVDKGVLHPRRLGYHSDQLVLSELGIHRSHILPPDHAPFRHIHVISAALHIPLKVIVRGMVRWTLHPFIAKPVEKTMLRSARWVLEIRTRNRKEAKAAPTCRESRSSIRIRGCDPLVWHIGYYLVLLRKFNIRRSVGRCWLARHTPMVSGRRNRL